MFIFAFEIAKECQMFQTAFLIFLQPQRDKKNREFVSTCPAIRRHPAPVVSIQECSGQNDQYNFYLPPALLLRNKTVARPVWDNVVNT
jgi:hypothetical protein